MKQLTKLIFLLTSIVTLSACSVLSNQSKKEEYEGYIERVSEVYPTEKVSDLFKKFPNGFEIEHTRTEIAGNNVYDHIINLVGEGTDKTITGTYKKIQQNGIGEVVLADISVTYSDEQGLTTQENYEFDPFAKSIKFLFTEKILSKNELSKMTFDGTGENPLLEDNFTVYYLTVDKEINNYLGIDESAQTGLIFRGSKHLGKSDHYYLSVSIIEKHPDGSRYQLREVVSEINN